MRWGKWKVKKNTWELHFHLCLKSHGLVAGFWWVQLAIFVSDLKLHCVLYSTSKWSGCLLWNNCDRRRKREESKHWLWTFQTNQYVVVFVWQQIPHRGKKSPIACWSKSDCFARLAETILGVLESTVHVNGDILLVKPLVAGRYSEMCDIWERTRDIVQLLLQLSLWPSEQLLSLRIPQAWAFRCNWRQVWFFS